MKSPPPNIDERAKFLHYAKELEREADFMENACACPKQATVFRLIAKILREDADKICKEKANAEDAKSFGHAGDRD